jgi:hypothetical protein
MCRISLFAAFVTFLGLSVAFSSNTLAAPAQKKGQAKAGKSSPSLAAAQRYVEAVAVGDRVAAGRLDFACQYQMTGAGTRRLTAFPAETDAIYGACWNTLTEAHRTAVEYRDQVMDVIWPGRGTLVFFTEDLDHYAPSFFFMEQLGHSPPGGGLRAEPLDSKPLPTVSFPFGRDGKTVGAAAALVRLRITYKDPLLSPITFAAGSYKFMSTTKRPRVAVRAVTVRCVVLSGLRKLGFAADVAVVDLPAAPATATTAVVPFSTEASRGEADTVAFWRAGDASGTLLAAVARAALFPDLRDRVSMLNRVLIVDPNQPEALTLLSRHLYRAILANAAAAHKIAIPEGELAMRFHELYWDIYAQTTRTDLSLGMEVGGFDKPTPADYLYRMIPAMERLAELQPRDLENRFHLSAAYRWNNDQLAAIATAEALVQHIPDSRPALRARALLDLAWSRIARVSWNRTLDDPQIQIAYKEAEDAFKLTDQPLDKFVGAYTMAYSLAFTPNRDNQAMLRHLTDARDWYLQLPDATPASWQYLLSNDTLKGVLAADPIFAPLIAATPPAS